VNAEGPQLEALTRRLAECPAEFLAEPLLGGTGSVHVAAVVSDLLADLGGPPLGRKEAAVFEAKDRGERNRLRTVLVAAWLLHDDWFRSRRQFAAAAQRFLAEGLADLASLVPAPRLVADPDRREELARLCLRALGLRPAGETVAQAQDRLTTLSSAERQRVIREAQEAERRARAVREAMAQEAARLAAARYSPE
jgi:hypothetical protein